MRHPSHYGSILICATILGLAIASAVVLIGSPTHRHEIRVRSESEAPDNPPGALELARIEVEAERPSTHVISGVVVDATGARVAGAVVQGLEMTGVFDSYNGYGTLADGREAMECQADEHGHFCLFVDPCRNYHVGVVPKGWPWVAGGVALAGAELLLRIPATADARVLVRRDGHPVDGVDVTAATGHSRFSRVVLPTRDGIAIFHSLLIDETVVFSAGMDEVYARKAFGQALFASEMDVVLDLKPESIIRGRIQLNSGSDGVGVDAEVRQCWSGLRRAKVRSNGEFEFYLFDPAPRALYCSVPGHVLVSETLPRTVGTWNPILVRGKVVNGVVISESGSPVPGCAIGIWETSIVGTDVRYDLATKVGFTDEHGRFRFEGVGQAAALVAFSRERGVAGLSRVRTDADNVVQVKPCGAIQGTGAPGRSVQLISVDLANFAWQFARVCNSGRFAFADVPPGVYRLESRKKRHSVTVRQGEEVYVDLDEDVFGEVPSTGSQPETRAR